MDDEEMFFGAFHDAWDFFASSGLRMRNLQKIGSTSICHSGSSCSSKAPEGKTDRR